MQHACLRKQTSVHEVRKTIHLTMLMLLVEDPGAVAQMDHMRLIVERVSVKTILESDVRLFVCRSGNVPTMIFVSCHDQRTVSRNTFGVSSKLLTKNCTLLDGLQG